MSVGIKVSIRCRPFTIDDKLAVILTQSNEEEGEVQLINTSYSTTRFGFSYAWWSAYGYQRHIQDNPPEAEIMKLVDQQMVYDSVGLKIKKDLLSGSAIVLFAYGLSGSGKTFTVFGPDAVDIPEAWFKHEKPHPLWGVFPRLAYELFNEKQDGWKISMKYFQNVVDTVRDLMSPIAQEQQYKSGMRKDNDGFMDIDWCQSVVLKDWDDLRKAFMAANSRKAIAPTQFNHQSTRGHCIMTLEVEKPDPEKEGMKQKGRVYICDLAGTEPAGDIVYAKYKKIQYENGDIEYKYIGPHEDLIKSRELQDQGKKINLSLTEMSQFFMKMAEAVQKNQIKPGTSIPGCNSYFLCKYLKDTMLQAKTYLFCAIRPEVTFQNYTFSTLTFAKNASVIKLQPKKATVMASPAERKLMAELEQMKLLVEQLQEEKSKNKTTDEHNSFMDEKEKLQNLLLLKQEELEKVLNNNTTGSLNIGGNDIIKNQNEEYQKRGVSLACFEDNYKYLPYLINLDMDVYRSKRFVYILKNKITTIGGSMADIRPFSLSIIPNHCSFEKIDNSIYLITNDGLVIYNGKKQNKGDRQLLKNYDRVVMGNELMLFCFSNKNEMDPSLETQDKENEKEIEMELEPTAEFAAKEYQDAIQTKIDTKESEELKKQLIELQNEKELWKNKKLEAENNGDMNKIKEIQEETNKHDKMEKEKITKMLNDQELRDILPKIKELSKIVHLLNRDMLSFETTLQSYSDNQMPKVKIKVHNSETNETIFLDVFEFIKAYSLLKDELTFLQNAIINERSYTAPISHDPITLLFDNSFHVGTAITFPEQLLYNLETDKEESYVNIKLAVPPFNTVGKLQIIWTPLSSINEEENNIENIQDIENPSIDLIGKSWIYKLNIIGATDLPVITDLAYCQYDFMNELYTTETVEQNTRSPIFNYSFIHHINCITREHIDYFQNQRIEFCIFISPYVMNLPKDKISTENNIIYQNISTIRSIKNIKDEDNNKKINELMNQNNTLQAEIIYLRKLYKDNTGIDAPAFLEEIKTKNSISTPRKNLTNAQTIDSAINTSIKV